jgi:hypothetical protein
MFDCSKHVNFILQIRPKLVFYRLYVDFSNPFRSSSMSILYKFFFSICITSITYRFYFNLFHNGRVVISNTIKISYSSMFDCSKHLDTISFNNRYRTVNVNPCFTFHYYLILSPYFIDHINSIPNTYSIFPSTRFLFLYF